MSVRKQHPDEGFSLVEVLVAIVIIGIVASSASWFFINGMQTSSTLERQQTAVSVATSAMETTYTYDQRNYLATGVSGLVTGRSASDVTAAAATVASLVNAGGSTVPGVSSMHQLSDPAGGTATLPVSRTETRAGVDYTIYTLVGACYMTSSPGGAAQDCGTLSGYEGTEPAPPGSLRLLRIITVVTWEPIGDECVVACFYDVSTLVDPSEDLEWNQVVEPEAIHDTFPFTTTEAGYALDLLDNDTVGMVPSFPVNIIVALPAGAGTLGTPASNGTVQYTPPVAAKATWVSGLFEFTYRLRDSRGQTSDATVAIYLLPDAADDTYSAYLGQATVLPVNENDLGSPVSISILSQPALGTLNVSGTTVTYTPSALGNDVFTYTYTDAAEQVSPQATVNVTVQAVSGQSATVNVPYRSSAVATAGWFNVSSGLLGTGKPADTKIVVTGLPTPSAGSPAGGSLRIDGVPYTGGTVTGTTVEFQPPAIAVGEWTFPFQLSLGSYVTSSYMATMRVPALAVNDSGLNLRTNGQRTVSAGANDNPTKWGSTSGVIVTLGTISSGCGTWTVNPLTTTYLNAGTLRITTSSSKSNCTATYTLTGGGVPSTTATISYRVSSSGTTG